MKKAILSSLIVLLAFSAFAQFDFMSGQQNNNTQQNITKVSLSLVPHYLAFYGLRADYDYQNGHKAYVFAPQLFFISRETHPISYRDADLYKLYGAGLQVNRKFIRSTSYNYTGYLSVGLGYNFFYTKFKEFIPEATTLYDNTVYLYSMQDITGMIHRLEVNATVGLENNLPSGIMLEPYLGIGYRYSMPFYSADILNPFDRAFDYAYTGPIFIIGLKIGVYKILSQNSTF